MIYHFIPAALWAIARKSLRLLSQCMSNLLKLLMERATWANRLKMSNSLGKNSKKSYFSYVFVVFPPFFAKELFAPVALCSVALFQRVTVSKLLRLLRMKELPWVICSRLSLQKSDCEQFAQVAHDKRVTAAICSFSRANRSFALLLTKKEWIARKTDERSPNPGF